MATLTVRSLDPSKCPPGITTSFLNLAATKTRKNRGPAYRHHCVRNYLCNCCASGCNPNRTLIFFAVTYRKITNLSSILPHMVGIVIIAWLIHLHRQLRPARILRRTRRRAAALRGRGREAFRRTRIALALPLGTKPEFIRRRGTQTRQRRGLGPRTRSHGFLRITLLRGLPVLELERIPEVGRSNVKPQLKVAADAVTFKAEGVPKVGRSGSGSGSVSLCSVRNALPALCIRPVPRSA